MIIEPEAKQGRSSTRLKITVLIIITLLLSTFGFKLGYVEGDIIRLKLDGCNYVLETDNGKRYELVDYGGGEINDTKIIFTRIDSGSFCMVGQMIKIIVIL